MRYPPGKLPEIVDAYDRDGLYFAGIRLKRASNDRVFELGISGRSYAALLRMFELRPFDGLAREPMRYYFVPAYSKRDDAERCVGTVRIEQGKDGRNFEVEMPQALIANLLWFYEMETLEPAAHLQSRPPTDD